MTEQANGQVIFVGVDVAAKDGDMSCETEIERRPDGTLVLKAVHTWRHELDLEALKD